MERRKKEHNLPLLDLSASPQAKTGQSLSKFEMPPRTLARKSDQPVYEYRYNYPGSLTFLSLQGPWAVPKILARVRNKHV